MTVQVQRLADSLMVRWVDPSRPQPPHTGTSTVQLCATCWKPGRDQQWTFRDVAAVPTPLMWARCEVCAAVTWYANVPATMLRDLEKKR